MSNDKIVVVTATKDEEQFIEKCILSVLNQTYPVTLHVIVDDCSDDKTVEIVKRFEHERIKLISSGLPKDRRHHSPRCEMVKHVGVRWIPNRHEDWRYLLVLDGDTWIPKNYCEILIQEMKNDPSLAMAGAKFLYTPTGIETAPPSHVRGCNYITSRIFYDQCRRMGYDVWRGEMYLERCAWILGWTTKNFPIKAYEGRETAISKRAFEMGRLYYRLRTPFLSVLVRLRKLEINSLKQICGWFYAMFKREKQHFTREENSILRVHYYKHLLNVISFS